MTDPKDTPWPNGLKAFLEKHGVKKLTDLLRKKTKQEPKPAPRTPYKDKDFDEPQEPD